MKRLLAAAILCTLVTARLPAQQRPIDDFFTTFTAEWIRANPDQATGTRYFTGEEQRRFERQLTPVTRAYQLSRIALAKKGLAELAAFDRSRVSGTGRVSAELMQWQLERVVQGEPYLDYFFPFEQFQGVNIGLVTTLTSSHPIVLESDANNYVARLALVATRMNEAIEEARRIAESGRIPPRFILRLTIAQMQQFIGTPAAENPYVTVLASKMEAIKAMPPSRRDSLKGEAGTIVSNQIYPAWRKAIALLEPLVARATDEAGLWRFDKGAEIYAYNLRRYTTTTMTADEIHQVGLREVARIEREMDALLRRIGRTDGSVNARVDQLKRDHAYPLTEDGRTRIMADIETMLRDAEKRAATLFDLRPKAPVMAQPFPRFQEANAAANYTGPAPDGSRPGVFRIPLRPDRMTRFGLRTLVYHETVPGHHFQVALDVENESLPRFRRLRAFGGIPALSEGWGLYAERMAAENGWYEGDLEGQIGQLDAELFRARRLVVDTGIHAKHWTRQQAIDYGIAPSEVERYVVYPGQACAYMIGQLKLIELRDKARTALGARFSAKDFHSAVLRAGTLPLELLERQIDDYIRTR
ncbi:MAG: hypothetical protein A3H97_10845 [Acidobacteria bacterium RIFCSPLOWO2_02_FULL_65_29]|nr:MAG: hypothetical protein A3H97_10845 [Acidobacteria bacterium RIFCSPLOWO2_02_FULL_65_29]